MKYRDLPEFGLHFVPFEDARFPELANAILAQPRPFPIPMPDLDDLRESAVLLNESGKAIVALSVAWTFDEGRFGTRYASNLASNAQLDFFMGIGEVQSKHAWILPGSKRLITEFFFFGSNIDVLGDSERTGRAGGFGFGGSGSRKPQSEPTELILDFVIFEDGLFTGPDKQDHFGSIMEGIELQRAVAAEAEQLLRNSATEGQVFDLLLPFVRPVAKFDGARPSWNLPMFSQMAIQQLIRSDRDRLIEWFARYASKSTFSLHRPQ
jgi:hypothetical protein